MKFNQKFLIYIVLFLIIVIFVGGLIKNGNTKNKTSDKIYQQPLKQVNDSSISTLNKISSTSALNKKINLSDIPRFVNHNFIELNKIAKISKFRSGVGHDFSRGLNETNSCRSMKHYLEAWEIDEEFRLREHNGEISKSDWPIVKYFAPVSGTIIDMRSAKNMYGETENQFIIQSKEYPNIQFLFFHVITNENIIKGKKVNEGDFLGTISPGNSGEIGVSINSEQNEQLISFFDIVNDKVFSEYKKRGVNSKQDFIITKEERDNNPLTCSSSEPHRFIASSKIYDKISYDKWSMSKDNWVLLN